MIAQPDRGRLAWPLRLALLVLGAGGGRALACATCGCGDPTLTVMGAEQPFRNRVRLALQEHVGGHAQGPPEWREHNVILRSALAVSYSPASLLTFGALVPMVALWSRGPGRARRHALGLGDAEFLARAVLYRDRRFAPRHLLGILGGIKTPTGPRLDDGAGYPTDDDQPGSGSWDPFAGASYSYFGDALALFASASYRYTTVGWHGYRRGPLLGATLMAQVQPRRFLALAGSLDLRFSEADVDGDGARVADTGGTVLSVGPSVLLSPRPDWLLRLSVQVPIAQFLNGSQKEDPSVILSLVRDI